MTAKGAGTSPKVWAGISWRGVSVASGAIRSPTTTVRTGQPIPTSRRTVSGPTRSSGVTPGYSVKATGFFSLRGMAPYLLLNAHSNENALRHYW